MSEFPYATITIADQDFDSVVNKYPLVLVDCWASWCYACHLLEPTIDSLARDYAGRIVFARLNTDENPQVPMKFGIMALPNLLVIKNGLLVDQIIGAVAKSRIESVLQKHL